MRQWYILKWLQYCRCLVVVVPCQDQMTSRARRPVPRAKTQSNVYHGDRLKASNM
jgi:hypothetical protein